MSTVIQSEMSALHKAWRRYKYFLPVVVLPVIMYISFNFLGYWSFFAFAFGWKVLSGYPTTIP